MILALLTSSYPYDYAAEQTFLEEEVRILAGKFERVILVPRYCRGRRFSLPDGVEVDESYAEAFYDSRLPLSEVLRSAFSSCFWSDLFARPAILARPSALARLAEFLAKARLTRNWVKSWLLRLGAAPREVIFYTYWFDETAMGIGMAKRNMPEIRVVSRAHGYDLYEERHEFPYLPCRRAAISLVDRLIPDSDAGLKYLQMKYPQAGDKYQTGRLGVGASGFKSPASADGAFRIVSCSRIVPVKRVGLLMEGVLQAAVRRTDVRFNWTHFGEGEERDAMRKYAAEKFPPNARADFPGYESQRALFEFYRDNPVDVFVNVSVSEGAPVAVMEALSCGIPVIATAVGGNVELVSSRNGILLPANPSPDEIASALLAMYEDRKGSLEKREASFQVWREKYNAPVNFTNFADDLMEIRRQRG
ncbi:MAG: glycosyltransferase [Chloroflexi bacterium]|nr:glycosyltransferase [Chloroflexota bacterium]